MKNNSIREALPRLAKYMILCTILLILPANIGFQMYIHHENQKASANEMFRQVGLLIETNEKDMEEVKNDFSERCIRAADMAAYFVQYNPEVKDSLERTIDAQSETIVAATADELIGRDVSEALDKIKSGKNLSVYHYRFGGKKYCVYVRAYEDYILARTFRSRYMMKNFVVSSVLVLIYVLAVGSSMIAAIIWYVNKRLSDNIDSVVQELEKIEEGNLENLTIQTDIQEFDELIARINQLMKSLRLSWDKFSTVIDKGRFPIGIYEENYFYKRVFFSERLIEILGISSEDTG